MGAFGCRVLFLIEDVRELCPTYLVILFLGELFGLSLGEIVLEYCLL